MRKTLWLVMFAGFAPITLTSQDVQHAPTVAQCQADHRLWGFQLRSDSSNDPDMLTLDGWLSTMNDCEKIDPANKARYTYVEYEIVSSEGARMTDFLNRHHLYEQFIFEDKAGKR